LFLISCFLLWTFFFFECLFQFLVDFGSVFLFVFLFVCFDLLNCCFFFIICFYLFVFYLFIFAGVCLCNFWGQFCVRGASIRGDGWIGWLFVLSHDQSVETWGGKISSTPEGSREKWIVL
jgi:hypothetical protein